jgi:hypothetical protein
MRSSKSNYCISSVLFLSDVSTSWSSVQNLSTAVRRVILGKERSALAARYTVKNTIFQSTDAKALLFPQIDSMSECFIDLHREATLPRECRLAFDWLAGKAKAMTKVYIQNSLSIYCAKFHPSGSKALEEWIHPSVILWRPLATHSWFPEATTLSTTSVAFTWEPQFHSSTATALSTPFVAFTREFQFQSWKRFFLQNKATQMS